MIVRKLAPAIALAALMLAAAAGLRYAQGAGLVGPDGARRTIQVLIGLMLAGYANLMPKQIGSANASPLALARTQAALRLGGWSLTLAGLAYAGLWAVAPLPVADTASMVVVAAATALTAGYAFWSYITCRGASAGR